MFKNYTFIWSINPFSISVFLHSFQFSPNSPIYSIAIFKFINFLPPITYLQVHSSLSSSSETSASLLTTFDGVLWAFFMSDADLLSPTLALFFCFGSAVSLAFPLKIAPSPFSLSYCSFCLKTSMSYSSLSSLALFCQTFKKNEMNYKILGFYLHLFDHQWAFSTQLQ